MTSSEKYGEQVEHNNDTSNEGVPKNSVLRQDLVEFFDEVQEKQQDVKKNISSQVDRYKTTLRGLREGIEDHKFTCIVGDDKSSRVPTLKLGKIINEIYSSRGNNKIPVLFIDPHNYTGSIGGNRGYGEKSDERYKVLKEKVRNLFEKAGVKGGTILLITDWVASGSTIKTFEDIARETGMEIHVLKDMADVGDTRGGLIRNEDLLSIHAKPRFISINNSEDVKRQLDIFEKDGSLEGSIESFYLRMTVIEIKSKIDKNFPIESELIQQILHGSGVRSTQISDHEQKSVKDLINFINNDLSFEQQKNFINLFRRWTIIDPRDNLSAVAKEASKWFSSREAKMTNHELYLEKRDREMRGGM